MQKATRKNVSAAWAGSLLAACVLSGGAVSAFDGAGSPANASEKSPENAGGGGSADGSCSVETLDVPEGTTDSWVAAGSPDGNRLVGYATVDGEERPMMWSNGKPREILVDLMNVSPAGINDEGVVAGFGFEHDEPVRTSFLYRDGETIELAAAEGADATVTDINADGDAVGYGVGGNSALRWDFDSPDEVERLPSPQENAVANAIDDGGTAAGHTGFPDEGTEAALWNQDGGHEALPALDGAKHSSVESIRGDFATGFSTDSMEDSTQALWNLEEGTVSQLPDSLYKAYDVNDSGVVGASTEDDRAAIVRDGEVVTLPHAGGDVSQAYTVADDDTAAGSSEDAAGNSQAVVWNGC